jgi:hypothetical protein
MRLPATESHRPPAACAAADRCLMSTFASISRRSPRKVYDSSVGVENVNPQEELKKLDEQIKSATELAALKPIYFRLNEIVKAFPGDFDVWVTGNDIKQRLMERGTVLMQQETATPTSGASTASGITPVPSSTITSALPVAPPPTSLDTVVIPPVAPAAPPTRPEASLPPMMPPAPPTGLSYPIRESAPPESAAPPRAIPPEIPPQKAARPPAPPRPAVKPQRPAPRPPGPPFNWKRPVVIGPVAALLVALVVILMVVSQAGKRKSNDVVRNGGAAVPVDIATTPVGASVRIAVQPPPAGGSHETTCTSNCKVSLAPGTYQISASLDGYDPVAGSVTVTAQRPASVNLTLQPAALLVRLLTDLPQGKVVLDSQPPADLQEGQLVIDKLPPGPHTVKITGPNGDASFAFDVANARMPAVTGPVNARNMIALLVASFGKQARVVTNAGPWKLAVNGQPQADIGPAGTDLTSFQPGGNEIVVGEGKDQRNFNETFGPAPMLTAFLKTDVNAGTLIVSTGLDDVHVFLNDKEYRRPTQHGQLRLQTLGKVTVRVAKSGFQEEPAQTVEVKKGAEVRVQFDLKIQPQFGSLQITGAVAGTEILLDQKNAGTVGADGSFNLGSIQPGEHTVELRREQYVPKRVQRAFRAGQTIELAGADVVLAMANGTIRLTRNPASAIVTYRRGDETGSHEARGNQIELPPGSYVFAAIAPGFMPSTSRVQLAAGESREVDFTMTREKPTAPPPPVTRGMADFEDAEGWKKDGDNWVHKGGGFVPYKLSPKGVFTFTVQLLKGGGVFRAGQIRWCLQYTDAKNYLLYELDRKNFWAGVIKKGERLERIKQPHNLGNQKAFTIQIEVTADHVVHRAMVGNEWKVLDTFAEPGRDFTQGKFGFLIQGNDEIAISDFKFTPR